MIGEFTAWSADQEMTRDLDNPDVFTTIVNLDVDTDENGFSDVKFRVLGDWGTNWGSADFPTGTGTPDGANVQAPIGTYKVTFNCTTGEYSFVTTCPAVGMIGEFTAWSADQEMTRDADDPNLYTTIVDLDVDTDENGFSDVKFRVLGDWGTNWGSADFPTGTGTPDGANVQAPIGTYKVTFNCSTGEYSFETTCPALGMIGEFTSWGADQEMTRDADNPNLYTTIVNLDVDSDANGFSDVKFRVLGDWGTNWGSADFPAGTGTPNGANILAPIGNYFVTFNCSTGEYSFVAACGEVSMIGAFNGWNGDVEMTRSAADPNEWSLFRSWNIDSQVKFRQNKDWTVNWGNSTWPTGIATDNGPNIPLVAGKYDVSFNCATGAYGFTSNDSYCGEIGLIGDFNEWGVENAEGFYTDAMMKRDPLHPGNFSLAYTFTAETQLLFRLDGDPGYNEVWGGPFPSGTGEKDPSKFIIVPGGTYNITFNCLSGDYYFERLGSSIYAPKVFAINVDGVTDEKDWVINEPVSKLLETVGTPDPNEIFFGVTYNDEFLFVGIEVKDGNVISDMLDGDIIAIGIDGDKSGGDFDDHDIGLLVSPDGDVEVTIGVSGYTPETAVTKTGDGYIIETKVEWAKLGVTPASGSQIAMDIFNLDYDTDGFNVYSWNSNNIEDETTSSFGAVNLGTLACGTISIYNDQIGDVTLRPTSNEDKTNSNTYVGSYEFESNMNVMFRKDYSPSVTWGNSAFPGGTATIGGEEIPVVKGRYRISFGCLDGVYSFTEKAADAGVAFSQFATTTPTIDGTLSEYKLDYTMAAGVVAGTGPANNEVKWGSSWDQDFVYFGVQVKDAKVEGAGNPWDNDAVEFYFDGNNDKDGTYDAEYDTQIILDFKNGDVVWVKADGAKITVADETGLSYGKWFATSTGYNVELKLPWADFNFTPARHKTMGFSIGNNDSDNGIGRDYQSAWFGDGNCWNDTKVLGDLQLAGGPLFSDTDELFYNESVVLYPNPISRNTGFYLLADKEVFEGKTSVKVFNMYGQLVISKSLDLANGSEMIDTYELASGSYLVHMISKEGKQAVKKIIVE